MPPKPILTGASAIVAVAIAFYWLAAPAPKSSPSSPSSHTPSSVTEPHPVLPVIGGPGLLLEVWRYVDGRHVRDLTSNPAFPDSPSSRDHLTHLELRTRLGDSYGIRLRGWITPPRSGKYRFWIAADDEGELWLSPTDKVKDKERVCCTREFTAPRQWDKRPEQESRWIALEANRRYYLEVLMKQEAGGDCLAVAWQGPGIEREVIAARYLTSCFPPLPLGLL